MGSSTRHGPVLWAARARCWPCCSTLGSWFKLPIMRHGLVQLYLTLLFLIFYLKSREFAHKKAVLNKQTNMILVPKANLLKTDLHSPLHPNVSYFAYSV